MPSAVRAGRGPVRLVAAVQRV